MEWRGRAILGARLAHALARIAMDRVVELFGAALPRTEAQLARTGVLAGLLGVDADDLGEVRLPGARFESSNCLNFLVETGGPGARRLYAKIPCPELATRAFANAVGFWSVECAFARNVAARVPVRVPRVHAVAERGARFVLLLENLHDLPGTVLFTNRDMAAGTDPDRARLCIETFAELHAAFWGSGSRERDRLVPLSLHPYLAPGGRAVTRALGEAAVGPAHRAEPGIFTTAHRDLCQRAFDRWDALVDAWYREPLTLVHGDSHLANCFEYPDDGRPRMGLIDFQGMHWCHGIRDVQYFLINSLEPGVLERHETELVDHYLGALSRLGISVDPEEARDRYRAYAFQTLMVAVVSLGLGSLTERDQTLRAVLRRSVAAVDRLGFGPWLDGLASSGATRLEGDRTP